MRVFDRKKSFNIFYLETKKLEYEYFEVLKTYVPMMLEKQEFFKSAFQ